MNDVEILALLTDEEREQVTLRQRSLLDRAVDQAADLMEVTPGDLVLDEPVQKEARTRLSVNAVREPYLHWLRVSADRLVAKRRMRRRGYVSIVPVLLCLLMLATGVVYAVAAAKSRNYLVVYGHQNLLFSAIAFVVAVGLALFVRAWRRPTRTAFKLADAGLRGVEDRFYLALRSEAESLLSTVLNERWEQSKSEVAALESSDAPRLVELEAVTTVPSKSAQEVYDFIEEHRTSAIGISGTRGIGKTTLMQAVQVRGAENYIGVYIPVPVHYEASEFFRTLFREVAAAILKSNREGMEYLERRKRAMRQRIDLVRLAVGPAFVIAGAVLISYGRSTDSFPVKPVDIPGLLFVLVGLGIAVVAALSSPVIRRAIREFMGPRYVERDISLAADTLQALDYSATHQRLSKNAFAVKLFTMEDQDQLELAERELTHPELVLKFKNFVSTFIATSPRHIIVALDELDKMENGEDALAFVNSIKDLLHIEGVHFLVSVSEDALHNFSLRGVPVRDVFDSSFDSIIPVQRFSVDESRNLLKSRVVGFPDPLSLFCHAMSGGVPRDLIRVARQCVRVRRESGAAVLVDQVVRTVVSRQALLVCEALAAKMRQEEQLIAAPFLEALPTMREKEDSATLVASIEETCRLIRSHLVADYPRADNAAAYLVCLSTLCTYFGAPRTNAAWEQERTSRASLRVAETVAGALELLRFESGTAAGALSSLRVELGITVAVP